MSRMQEEAKKARQLAKKRQYSQDAAGELEAESSKYTFAQRMQIRTLIKDAIEMGRDGVKFAAEDELAREGCIVRTYLKFSKMCAIFAESAAFSNVVIIMILLAGITIGIDNTVPTHVRGSPDSRNLLGKRLDVSARAVG